MEITRHSEENERYNMIIDEKKRKRMISNRESARRSRMKREQHVKDLTDQIMFFKNRSIEMNRRIDEFAGRYAVVEAENQILRAQREELRKRLESAQLVSSYFDAPTGYSVDLVDDPWLRPWQPPSQSQLPILTSASIFHV